MGFIGKSPWIIHYDGSSCNGCDIEVLACLTPVYDVERLGIINTGNPKHADILLITGSINEQNKEVILNIYYQMADPKVVVAVGVCACSGGIFRECYNVLGGIDKILPVDVYVPGCAARPESIIEGVAKSLSVLEQKQRQYTKMASGLEDMIICRADVDDIVGIFGLYRLVLKNESDAEIDPALAVLFKTPEQLISDCDEKILYKAVMNSQIVGVIEGVVKDDVCELSRAIVHPTCMNHGIAGKLLETIERHFIRCSVFETTVWRFNKKENLFYERNGYKIIKHDAVADDSICVYFRKNNPRYREASCYD